MSTAIFYDLENISKFTTPKNHDEFKKSLVKISESELVDEIILQRAYISTNHPAYIKYHRFLKSTGIEICGVNPVTNSNKANLVDFKMNVDCVAYSLSHELDTVVVATGDADFGFLVDELKAYGKRVVVASYGITTNKSIIMISDDWVDFSGEYALCDINELMIKRIRLGDPIDYRDALHQVITAMLNDKLIKRYMALERFDIDMLKAFTERFYRAPYLENVSYLDFVQMLLGGLEIELRDKNGRVVIVPSAAPLPEPPLSIYEVIAGVDPKFSIDRFRAWHTWFEENSDSANELIYYMNFMLRSGLLKVGETETEIVPQRKCAAALIEHTAAAVSLLNIKPDEKELDKLKNRFYRNPPKRRTDPVEEETSEPEIYVQGVTTNFGRVVAYADNEAVIKVEFTEEFVKYLPNDITAQATTELREYFKGDRKEFTVPIKMEGSNFQKLVWQELLKIPYGETRSYKQIAEAIGRPKSSRAVGNACNRNKLLFIVPCHRAIGSSGSLTGYAGGLELKKALLRSEASPVDFKRFGKQYSYNAKHPDDMGEYRTYAEIQAVIEREKAAAEARREAEERATQEAEQKRLAEEKAKQEAEQKRLAEEKAKQEAEQKQLAEEKAKREAEQKRLAEEKAKQQTEQSSVVTAAENTDAPQSKEESGESKPVSEEKPKPKRRSSRRRKKPEKSADEAVTAGEEKAAETIIEDKPEADTPIKAESSENSSNTEKPKRKTVRRRRKPAEGSTPRKYSAKKHVADKKEDSGKPESAKAGPEKNKEPSKAAETTE